jgi:hypothetical protein
VSAVSASRARHLGHRGSKATSGICITSGAGLPCCIVCQCGSAFSAGEETYVLLSSNRPSRLDLRASTYEGSVHHDFLFVPFSRQPCQLGRWFLPGRKDSGRWLWHWPASSLCSRVLSRGRAGRRRSWKGGGCCHRGDSHMAVRYAQARTERPGWCNATSPQTCSQCLTPRWPAADDAWPSSVGGRTTGCCGCAHQDQVMCSAARRRISALASSASASVGVIAGRCIWWTPSRPSTASSDKVTRCSLW